MRYRHEQAVIAIGKAEERRAVELWREGKLRCPYCGQSLEPREPLPERMIFETLVVRLEEDPLAWLAMIYDVGTPGRTVEELAKLLRASPTTAHRARARAAELLRSSGMGHLTEAPAESPTTRAKPADGHAERKTVRTRHARKERGANADSATAKWKPRKPKRAGGVGTSSGGRDG